MKAKHKRDEFKLRIAGVSLGIHRYSITCDQEFFEIAGITELEGGTLKLDIIMEKSETMLHLSFRLKGEVIALCDRCLDPVTLPLDIEEVLIVKFVPLIQEDNESEDDMIWTIHENEYELDVFHFVYETIRLALPIQIVHPQDANGKSTCNPEVLKQLGVFSQKETFTDSRWEALKNIKLD